LKSLMLLSRPQPPALMSNSRLGIAGLIYDNSEQDTCKKIYDANGNLIEYLPGETIEHSGLNSDTYMIQMEGG
jgi:hypothetical protein